MIEFDCPHCGNHFRVEEKLGGRHGWCRICRGFIIVPSAHSSVRWEQMPAEQRVVRLEKILRATTELYNEQHTQLLALQRELEKGSRKGGGGAGDNQVTMRLKQAERDLMSVSRRMTRTAERKGAAEALATQAAQEREAAADALAKSEAAREALAKDLDRLKGLEDTAARCEALKAECDTLRQRLAEREADLQAAHTGAGTGAATAGMGDADRRRLLNQLDEARAARDEAKAARDGLAAEQREIEKRLAEVSADAVRWKEEAARLAPHEAAVTELRAKWDEAQALVRELHPAIAEAHETRGRAEAAAQAAEERAAALEERCSRLTEEAAAQRGIIAEWRDEAGQAHAAAKAAEREAEAARREVQRLEPEVVSLREAALQAALVAPLTAERDHLRDSLVEAEAQLLRLKDESTPRAEETTASGELARQEREAIAAERAQALQAKSDAERKAQSLSAELHQVQTRLDQAAAERDRLAAESASHQEKAARFDDLAADLANAQARLEESQRQVDLLTERLATMGGPDGYSRGGAAGRTRGYGAPVIPDGEPHDIALIPELLDEDSSERSQELMASMLRFIEPPAGNS